MIKVRTNVTGNNGIICEKSRGLDLYECHTIWPFLYRNVGFLHKKDRDSLDRRENPHVIF